MCAKVLGIVTGAGRGFGKCVALELGKRLSPECGMVLIGRDLSKLNQTRAEILESTSLKVRCVPADLSDLDTLEHTVSDALEGSSEYLRGVLINNAGSLGPLGRVGSPHVFTRDGSLNTFKKAIDLNITSCFWFSNEFSRTFVNKSSSSSEHGLDQEDRQPSVIVNVSSLAAVAPLASWSTYCAGKSARNMFHKVIALENGPGAGIKTLNYAPGPMDTDMLDEALASACTDSTIRESYSSLKKEGKLQDPMVSAKVCVDYAMGTGKDYPSGGHVDVFSKTKDW